MAFGAALCYKHGPDVKWSEGQACPTSQCAIDNTLISVRRPLYNMTDNHPGHSLSVVMDKEGMGIAFYI